MRPEPEHAESTTTRARSQAPRTGRRRARRPGCQLAAQPDPPTQAGDVRIRMYGQGFGDCFLLTFPRVDAAGEDGNARAVHVLVDCGVVSQTPDDTTRLASIVDDIATTTGGRLDLLIVTHEHWDHLSGFVKATEQWNRIAVDQLWTAWTENGDTEGLPGVLKRLVDKQRVALTRIADQAMRLGLEERYAPALGLMGFQADDPDTGTLFAARPTVSDAFDAAKRLVPPESHVCCEPGDIRTIPGTGATAYVLGPPRSDTRLRQTGPSKARETYESDSHAGSGSRLDPSLSLAELDARFPLSALEDTRSQFNAVTMAVLGPTLLGLDGKVMEQASTEGQQAVAEWETYEQTFPFDRTHRVSLSDAERMATERPYAFPALASYVNDVNHWRRIDFDWLAAEGALALHVDNLTNNTSLAMAIELPSSTGEKRVLLFPGDAQVGNWLSWYDIKTWNDIDGGNCTTPGVDDLLRRVTFYKAGHHGSHNATLKELGVEKMPDDGSFTAFVPVSEPVAELIGWGKIPLESLMDALATRTGGRVVFPDGNVWPRLEGDALDRARQRIGLTVSDTMLPPKARKSGARAGEVYEDEVPLWVEISIAF